MAQFPNQYNIQIHKNPSPKRDFIQVEKNVFANAYKKLSRSSGALALYIWLVGNQDMYKFEFSPQAILNNLGMPLSTTHDAIKRLKNAGFLIKRENSATHDFYETARESVIEESIENKESNDEGKTKTPLAKHSSFIF